MRPRPHHVVLLALMTSWARGEDVPRPPLPVPVPDWAIEKVAEGETFAARSMRQAPNGTLYLGLRDRVAAFRDGKLAVFAEGLGPIHGLEQVDGEIVVAHGSVMTVLRDLDGDGQAERRSDVVTGLEPNVRRADLGYDRCVGGIRLGIDGFLYIAVGDQGIPRATGTDGRTLSLRGGGVIRVRPDGTGLEVFSTGECNPRSVILTTSDVFTFGPADPVNRWPGGLTHVIDGGHNGYPFQFLAAPFRSLPTLGNDAGKAVGEGICYDEEGLPAPFRGNFVLCETSRQRVDLVALRRAGGTFAVARRTSLVSRGALEDFHPVSVEPTRDGTGFWIADEGRGPGAPGRLFRVVYRGKDRVQPTPRAHDNDLAALLAGLDHAGLSARLNAQRELVAIGANAVRALIERLRAEQPEAGRVHALWALDAIGTDAARQAIRTALNDPSPTIRLAAARSCGIRQDRSAASDLATLLSHREAAVRREAAVALGRVGDVQAVTPLLAALGDADRFAAWSVRTAIRQLGYPDRSAMASALLDPQRRESGLILADESWSVPVTQALVEALQKASEPAVRGRLIACLAGQYRRLPDWKGDWWGPTPLAGPLPSKTREWAPEGMATVLQGLRLGLGDSDAGVRYQSILALGQVGRPAAPALLTALGIETDQGNQAAMVEALGETGDIAAIRQLTHLLTDGTRSEPVRAAVLDALARLRGPEVLRARFTLVYDTKTPESLVARALPPLARDGYLPLNDLAGFLEHASPVIRTAALMSLNTKKPLPPDIARQVLDRLDDPSPQVRQAAMLAVGALRLHGAVPRLLEVASKPAASLRAQALAALCRIPDRRAIDLYRQASSDSDPSLRRAASQALRELGAEDPSVARTGAVATVRVDPTALARFAVNHPGDPRAGETLFYEARPLRCAECHTTERMGPTRPETDRKSLGKGLERNQIIAALLEPTAPSARAHEPFRPAIISLTPPQFADLISFLQERQQEPRAATGGPEAR